MTDAEEELGAAAINAWDQPRRTGPRTRGGAGAGGAGPRTRGGCQAGDGEGAASEGEASSSGEGADGGVRQARKRRNIAPAGDAADAELAELGDAAAARDAVRG